MPAFPRPSYKQLPLQDLTFLQDGITPYMRGNRIRLGTFGGTNCYFARDAYGPHLRTTSASTADYLDFGDFRTDPLFTIPFTLIIVASVDNAAAATGLFSTSNIAGNTELRIDSGSSSLQLVKSYIVVLGTGDIAVKSNVPFCGAVSYDGATVHFAVDGRFASSDASTTTFTNSAGFGLGNFNSVPNAHKTYAFAMLQRALPAGRLVEITANPWKFFYPQPRRPVLYGVTAAGGTAFAPYWYRQHVAGGMTGASS